MNDEDVCVETAEEEYKITGKGSEIIQKYDFSDYSDETVNEIKDQIEYQLKDTISSLRRIYSDNEIEIEFGWHKEESLDVVEIKLSADQEVSFDFVSTTIIGSFISRSPKKAYSVLLENKKWIETYQKDKIADLMENR